MSDAAALSGPTLGALYRQMRQALHASGNESAALDARLLLCHVLDCTHEEFVLRADMLVDDGVMKRARHVLERRLQSCPVAKIIGRKEFYGRDFITTAATLDPRPDSETLIGAVLSVLHKKPPKRLLDLGTGTGCLALTLLAEWPQAQAVAVDLSAEALAVARRNAEALGVDGRVTFIQGDWLDPVDGQYDLVVSNPPYIPDSDRDSLARDVRDHDPALALFGGLDGLDPYRCVLPLLPSFMASGALLALELGKGQDRHVAAMARQHGFTGVTIHPDLAGIGRVVTGFAPPAE